MSRSDATRSDAPRLVRVGLVVIGAVTLMAVVGVVGSIVSGRNWEADNVPPELRADRWELTRDGRRARDLAEAGCGPLPEGAWVDFPPGTTQPVLKGAPSDQTTCFDRKIAPVFTVGQLREPTQ